MDDTTTQINTNGLSTMLNALPGALPVDNARDPDNEVKEDLVLGNGVLVARLSEHKYTAAEAKEVEIGHVTKPPLWRWFVNPIGAYHDYVIYRFYGGLMHRLAMQSKNELDELRKSQQDVIKAAESVTKDMEQAKEQIEENNRLNAEAVEHMKTQADHALSSVKEALEAGNKWKEMALKADNILEKCVEAKRKKVEELIESVFWEDADGEKKVARERTTEDCKQATPYEKDESILDEDHAITKTHLEKLATLDDLMDDVAILAQELVDIQKGLDYDLNKKNAPAPLVCRSKAIYHPVRSIGTRVAQLRKNHIKNHPKPGPGTFKYTWDTIG